MTDVSDPPGPFQRLMLRIPRETTLRWSGRTAVAVACCGVATLVALALGPRTAVFRVGVMIAQVCLIGLQVGWGAVLLAHTAQMAREMSAKLQEGVQEGVQEVLAEIDADMRRRMGLPPAERPEGSMLQ